jgi:hypothetical protein
LQPKEINEIRNWLNTPTADGAKWVELMGPVKGRAKKVMGQVTDWSAKAAEFEGRLKPVQQMYGRFMEGGVLRKEDEIKYEKQFPQITDRPDIAKFKLDVVNDLVSRYYDGLLSTFTAQGYDVSGYERTEALKKLDNEIVIMENATGEKLRVPKDKVASAPTDYEVTDEKFSDGVKGAGEAKDDDPLGIR